MDTTEEDEPSAKDAAEVKPQPEPANLDDGSETPAFAGDHGEKRKKTLAVVVSICLVILLVIASYTAYDSLWKDGGALPQVSGTLGYMANESHPESGIAKFNITLEKPTGAFPGDVHVTIYDKNGNATASARSTFIYSGAWDGSLSNGDQLSIAHNGYLNISGYTVVLDVSGYSGTITGSVPSA